MKPAPFKVVYGCSPAPAEPVAPSLVDPATISGYRSVWVAVCLYCALQMVVLIWTIPHLFGVL